MELVGLIDCNNFFVSCERLFRPDLRNRPVLVLSSNDGCVVARSQEVKDMGISMGVPYFQIKDIIKDNGVTCFSSNFALYRDISARVFTVLRSLCATVEQYSIDEAFFRVTGTDVATIQSELSRIKNAVEQRVGIPVSVAAAQTKTLAKLVNAQAKRTGGIGICLGDFVATYGSTPIGDVWGVGRELRERYHRAGITTVRDLVDTPPRRVETLFGVVGVRLQYELQGISMYDIAITSVLPQSIMSTRSFGTKTTDLSVIKDALAHHVRNVFNDLQQQSLLVGMIRILLLTSRHGDFARQGTAMVEIPTTPLGDVMTGMKLAMRMIDTMYQPGVVYSKVGCVVGGLIPRHYVTPALWENDYGDTTITRRFAIDQVLQKINDKHHTDVIRIGAFAKQPLWENKKDALSPSYTTRWSDIAVVSAIP